MLQKARGDLQNANDTDEVQPWLHRFLLQSI